MRHSAEEPNLFTHSTTRLAGEKAALNERSRKARILQLLKENGPLALFEIAQRMEVHDHQISGRITELYRDNQIDATGQRRKNPTTGCQAEVYKLHDPSPGNQQLATGNFNAH